MTVPSSSPSLSFRPATAEDVPLLLPLIRSAYRGESSRKGWTTEADLIADKRIDAEGLLAKITEPHGVVLMVSEDNHVPATNGSNTADSHSHSHISSNSHSSSSHSSSSSKKTTTTTTATRPLACCEIARRADGVAAYFGLFAVDPDRQAGGVGRKVLGYAEAYARETWGVGRMVMWVIWTRAELISWYERRGYRRTGETEKFPYEGLVEGEALRDDLYFVVLEKELE